MIRKIYFLVGLILLSLGGFSQYQLPNNGFNDWGKKGGEFDMPNSYDGTSFSAGGGLAKMTCIFKETNGIKEGSAAVRLSSGKTPFNMPVTPGYISNATFWNTEKLSGKNDAGFKMETSSAFNGRPEALKVWVKSSLKSGDNSVIRIQSWTGNEYVKSSVSTDKNKYVKESNKVFDSRWVGSNSITEWKEITIPLDYKEGKEGTAPEKLNIVFSASNYDYEDRGEADNIEVGSQLWVDDFKFIYPAKLKDVKIDGKAMAEFDVDVLEYNIVLPAETTIPGSVTAFAVLGGKITKKEATTVPGTTEITVTSEDGLVVKVYKFKFDAVKLNIVTAEASTGGSVVIENPAAGNKYLSGVVLKLQATPSDDSYKFVRWWDNNTENPRDYTVTEDKVITAVFEKKQFAITASAGANGAISPSGVSVVIYGANRTYNITPNRGYSVDDILVDNQSVGFAASYTFENITSNHTISASFVARDYRVAMPTEMGITATAVEGYDPNAVKFGADFKFKVALNYGYTDSDITVKANNVVIPLVGGVYTITNVDKDQIIVVTGIIENEYTLTLMQGVGGTITRSPMKAKYKYNEVITLSAKANQGWKFKKWDNENLTNPYQYMIKDNTTIGVVFEEKKDVAIHVSSTQFSYDYDGSAKEVAYTTTPVGLACEVTYNGVKEAPVKVGEYDVVISRAEDDNYKEAVVVYVTMAINGLPTTIVKIPTASAVNEGQMLSQSVLTGGEGSVEGVFVWTNPKERMLASGEFSVTFMPNDGSYSPSTCMVYVEVVAATIYYTVSIGNCENGRVIISNKDIDDKYAQGSNVELHAVGSKGYVFDRWWNGSTENPTTIKVDGNVEVTATFVFEHYNVMFPTVDGVTFNSDLNSIECGGDFRFTTTLSDAYSNSKIKLIANGVTVLLKDGDEYVIKNVRMNQEIAIMGLSKNQYKVAIEQTEGGLVTVTPHKSIYEHGDVVTLLPECNEGYMFKDWSCDVAADGSYTVVGAIEIAATFEAKPEVQVMVSGTEAVYDGKAKGISYTTLPEGLTCVVRYNGDTKMPTDVGVYNVNIYREDDDNYLEHDSNVVLVIAKSKTMVSKVPTSTTITVGDKLSASVLDGGLANTDGYFEWKNPDIEPTITAEYDAIFVANNMNYESVGCYVWVNVIQKYSVVAENSTDGVVSIKNAVADNIYLEGTVLNLEATGIDGYHFVSWWDGNMESVRNYTVEGHRVITANFAKDVYDITATSNENGWITPSGVIEVKHGESQSFVITPNENYIINKVIVDGNEVELINNIYTFENVNKACNITATFRPGSHTIIAIVEGNGKIDPVGETAVEHGSKMVYIITPDKGYTIARLEIDGEEVEVASTYTFEEVTEGHTIKVTFKKMTYTITATVVGNGTISPEGVSSVEHGESLTYTMKAAEGWVITKLTVDGNQRPIEDTYTFTNITKDRNIEVEFQPLVGVESVEETQFVIRSWSKTIYVGSDSDGIADVLVYDMAGRTVKQLRMENRELEIAIDKAGIYVVKVVAESKIVKTNKVVIK